MGNTNAPVWFITGCSTGFGREIAKLILGRGWNAVITARKTDQINDIAEGYEDTSLVISLDVTDQDQIASAVKAAQEKFGKIDVLVNNAGYGYFSSIEEGEQEKIRAQFETNFFGLVNMIQAVLPGMRDKKHGHIINFSSIGGLRAFTSTGYYHATKFAVEGLSESLSQEVGPLGIKVLLVEPGPFRTDWAGRSTSRTPTQIADYEPTVGARMTASQNSSGKQQGDPVRGSEAIIKAVEAENHQLRLLLGEPAYKMALEKVDMMRENFESLKDLTISADFPLAER
ncbi:NADP-dependent 3-hydroxy acid dehydrogenase YdfG [Pedobacter westerhofensis]|uniref:NADP-dependent 3-hydroxy acid dehydrogenase YdfG n=1 Tax=Pedobacter westerhofensis TaxID=425512 RepID=A0A521ALE5_9SPHI|nr:oxidoreductase [Pedobacter westerhofensis]SMO35603.1 NADP-dependent 3-hydroxy acid dehydrogenase YdfG [Pedobacter westerhofensis]